MKKILLICFLMMHFVSYGQLKEDVILFGLYTSASVFAGLATVCLGYDAYYTPIRHTKLLRLVDKIITNNDILMEPQDKKNYWKLERNMVIGWIAEVPNKRRSLQLQMFGCGIGFISCGVLAVLKARSFWFVKYT